MTTRRLTFICGLVFLFAACTAKPPTEKSGGASGGPAGAAAKLTTEQYKALTPAQQYQVSNKLLATFFKGVPASEFFDLTAGTSDAELEVSAAGNSLITDTEAALSKKLDNPKAYNERVTARNTFVAERAITAKAIAAIREYPISRDMFEAWMAYILANTILFSPAEEIDSADFVDVEKVFSKLIEKMQSGATVNDIVYSHMVSQENWRRFRSPEDNTREMIEIYLGLFDRDADVPKASIACKNWYLTGEDAGYQLLVDPLNPNTEQQRVLDNYVTTCQDFYEVVAKSPLVIPRVTTVLVDHFFPEKTSEERAALVQSIAASKPTTFHQIFTAIVFSKAYLLDNERPLSFEEAFFNLADRIHWVPDTKFYSNITDPSAGNTPTPTLTQMKQPAMSLKLGRFAEQPLDSLSFAYFHKLIREKLLIDTRSNTFSTTDSGWDGSFIQVADFLIGDEFINYLFVAVAGRTATAEELTALNAAIVARAYETNRQSQAMVILDYLSRLPEIYYAKAVK